MKRIILFIKFIILCLFVNAQGSIDRVVSEVLHNNLKLKTLKNITESEFAGNRTNIFPENPSIEFGYLWGSPSELGNRTDLSITQSFDFPTSYMYRNQISDIKDKKLSVEYKNAEIEVRLNTKLICVDLIRYNAMEKILQRRVYDAVKLENSCLLMFEKGEYNILELNKAKLNRLNAENTLELITIDQQTNLERLKLLNGNNDINFTDTIFPAFEKIEDFENWFINVKENIPELKILKYKTEISKKCEKLNFAESLPKIETGYMSEKVADEQFQGITLGITVPLWENKNKGKYAKLKTDALLCEESEREQAYYSQLKEIHLKVSAIKRNIKQYETILHETNNSEFLLKALDLGEIGLIEYLTELMFFYESVDRLIEMKSELLKNYLILTQYN